MNKNFLVAILVFLAIASTVYAIMNRPAAGQPNLAPVPTTQDGVKPIP